MNDFNVGDEVRRIHANRSLPHRGMVIGDTDEVTEIVDDAISLKKFGTGHGPDQFELVRRTRHLPTTDTSWQFNSKHPEDINWDELTKDMSYKNPLLFIERGENFFVVVHMSLSTKARLVGDEAWEETVKNTLEYLPKGILFECDQANFSDWIKWAKQIKLAPWPDKDDQVVKVRVPTV